MSFLKDHYTQKEIEQKEKTLKNLREERRQNYIKSGHKLGYYHLLFSEDDVPIPYVDTDDKDYLINGEQCENNQVEEYDFTNPYYYKDDKFEKLKYNEFILVGNHITKAYEHVKFLRSRTKDEQQFKRDYDKLISYKTVNSILKFKPNTNNPFTLSIFNMLKEQLKNGITLPASCKRHTTFVCKVLKRMYNG